MRKQPLFGAGKHALCLVFLCCAGAFALPASRQAANPGFADLTPKFQQVQTPPAAATWQIKGAGSVKNLPNNTSNLKVTIVFEKRTSSTAAWSELFKVEQAHSPGNSGTADLDTGFIDLTTAPASGNQYRIKVSGKYTVGGQTTALPAAESDPVTPVP
jgi:hypothetical protein